MVATTAQSHRPWLSVPAARLLPPVSGLALLLVVFAVAFLPSILWIGSEWSGSSGVLSHGYLLAAVSLFLTARAVPEVVSAVREPNWWMLIVVLGLSGIWLLGYAATVAAVQTVVLPVILLSAIAASYGLSAARRLVFPILLIYLALPVVAHLQFVFQAITVYADRILVQATGIPAIIDGNKVHLAQGTFEIAGGCSGLNFVVAGLSLAVLYGHMFYSRVSQSLKLVMLTAVVAMFGNWIRVFAIIMLGYKTDMQSPLVADHLTLGWVLFAILMVPVFVLARRWEEPPTVDGELRIATTNNKPSRVNAMAVGITALVMAAGPVWAARIAVSDTGAGAMDLSLPVGVGGWVGPVESHWGWQPKFERPDAEQLAEYEKDERVVLAYTNIYQFQEQGRELIYFSNDIVGEWIIENDNAELVTASGTREGLSFSRVIASSYLGDWLIWYRYEVGDKFESTGLRAKLSQALETLQGRSSSGAVAFATLCRPTCDEATRVLSEFVTEFGHDIHISESRDKR